MFTQRHYEEIAKVIKRNFHDAHKGILHSENSNLIGFLVDTMEMFEADNPKFDRARFIDACGTGISKPEVVSIN